MANSRSTLFKVIGLVLIVGGIGAALWGYNMSESVGSQVTEAVTGNPGDKVMVLVIGGAAALIAGLFLVFRK